MAFAFYSPITVDHTQVPSTQSSFPVSVNATDNRLKTVANGGHVRSSSGFDIRPYSDTGLTSALTYELETYNSSTGALVMWVNISSLSSSADTVFYLAYGDAGISTDGSSSSTWDSNYKGVWHLKDGTTLSLSDSTANANTLTNTGTVGATTGRIDGAAGAFNGTSQALNTPSINLGNFATLSMWLDVSSFPGGDKLLAELSTNFNSAAGGFIVNPNSSATGKFDVVIHEVGGGANFNGGNFNRPSTGLHYYVFTFDTTTGTALGTGAYVDGTAQTMTQNNSFDLTGALGNFALYFCSRAAASLFLAANSLDEIRLSNSIRSQNWVTCEFNNQKSGSTFISLGTEVPIGVNTGGGGVLLDLSPRHLSRVGVRRASGGEVLATAGTRDRRERFIAKQRQIADDELALLLILSQMD